jgi:hypothetical protein
LFGQGVGIALEIDLAFGDRIPENDRWFSGSGGNGDVPSFQ